MLGRMDIGWMGIGWMGMNPKNQIKSDEYLLILISKLFFYLNPSPTIHSSNHTKPNLK